MHTGIATKRYFKRLIHLFSVYNTRYPNTKHIKDFRFSTSIEHNCSITAFYNVFFSKSFTLLWFWSFTNHALSWCLIALWYKDWLIPTVHALKPRPHEQVLCDKFYLFTSERSVYTTTKIGDWELWMTSKKLSILCVVSSTRTIFCMWQFLFAT